MAHLGAQKPAMYHLDHTRAGSPRARSMPEEIARVVRARAANPGWASGMMRHGFRGAAEVAAAAAELPELRMKRTRHMISIKFGERDCSTRCKAHTLTWKPWRRWRRRRW